MTRSLVLTVAGLGTAHLVAFYLGRRAPAGVLKPLPVLVLALAVITRGDPSTGIYAASVAAGLVCSAFGDVSLVFPGGFIAGLSAFLVAHLCYIRAFAAEARMGPLAAAAAVVLIAFAASMFCYLRPHLARRLVAPVAVYVTILCTMAWCAVARALASPELAGAAAAAVGSTFFLASDSVLAIDRFAHRFAAAHGIVMVTYYLAQLLIAASVLATTT